MNCFCAYFSKNLIKINSRSVSEKEPTGSRGTTTPGLTKVCLPSCRTGGAAAALGWYVLTITSVAVPAFSASRLRQGASKASKRRTLVRLII